MDESATNQMTVSNVNYPPLSIGPEYKWKIYCNTPQVKIMIPCCARSYMLNLWGFLLSPFKYDLSKSDHGLIVAEGAHM